MFNRIIILCIFSIFLGKVASAQSDIMFEECEHILTVQSKSCLVTQVQRCDDGTTNMYYYDNNALIEARRSDKNHDSEIVHFALSGLSFELDRAASILPDFIEETEEEFSIKQYMTQIGDDAYIYEYNSKYRLLNETIIIDGEALRIQKYSGDGKLIYKYSGAKKWHDEGTSYFHPKYKIFLSGYGAENGPSQKPIEYDYSPIKILEKGEIGFQSTTPVYECDDIS